MEDGQVKELKVCCPHCRAEMFVNSEATSFVCYRCGVLTTAYFMFFEKQRTPEYSVPDDLSKAPAPPSPINHPPHYNKHPSGIECIEIVRHMNFNLGNAVKYIWRAGLKSSSQEEDLKTAIWYLQDELQRLTTGKTNTTSPASAPPAV